MEEKDPYHNRMSIHISSKTMFRALLVVAGAYLFFQLTNVILIVLTSIVIASTVEHIVKYFEKYKVPRPVTVVTLYVLSLTIITLFTVFVIPIFIKELSSLIDFVGKLFQKTTLLQDIPLDTLSQTKDYFAALSGDVSSSELVRTTQVFLGKVSTGLGSTVGTIFGSIFNMVMVAVISFYLSIQERGVQDFLRIVSPVKYQAYIISLWHRTEKKIALWVRGQMLLGLIVTVILFIGLTLLHVKYALLLALIAGFFELIPYGMLIAFIPAIAIAFTEGSIRMALTTTILYVVVQQIEGYILVPIIVKKATGVSSLVVILALFIGGTLAGFWGILLAVPVAVLLIEYLSDVEQDKLKYLEEKENKATV